MYFRRHDKVTICPRAGSTLLRYNWFGCADVDEPSEVTAGPPGYQRYQQGYPNGSLKVDQLEAVLDKALRLENGANGHWQDVEEWDSERTEAPSKPCHSLLFYGVRGQQVLEPLETTGCL